MLYQKLINIKHKNIFTSYDGNNHTKIYIYVILKTVVFFTYSKSKIFPKNYKTKIFLLKKIDFTMYQSIVYKCVLF